MQYPKLQPLKRSVICYLKAYFKNFLYIQITIQFRKINLEIHFSTEVGLMLFVFKTEYNIFVHWS